MITTVNGCINLVYSPDDGGWYGHEFDFQRAGHATRTTRRIYRTREALMKALHSGTAKWGRWG